MLRGLGAFSRPLGVWRLATPTPRAPGSRLQFIELQILAIERTPRGVFLVFLFFFGGGEVWGREGGRISFSGDSCPLKKTWQEKAIHSHRPDFWRGQVEDEGKTEEQQEDNHFSNAVAQWRLMLLSGWPTMASLS